MIIIDGRKIAAEKLGEIAAEVSKLNFRPKLIDLLVGVDPVTESYVKIKAKRAEEVGIDFEAVRCAKDISQGDLENAVKNLNKKENLCGLIIQLPLPKHFDKQAVLDCIDPELDADVITSFNSAHFGKGAAELLPATAAAILEILKSIVPDFAGKNILVIGQGELVGRPVTVLLRKLGTKVITADQSTKNLTELARAAEIIISGTGQPKLLNAGMVNSKHIIIDAGTAESAGGISGDADFENIKDKVRAITPVPGGVGPVTVAMLLENVLKIAKKKENL